MESNVNSSKKEQKASMGDPSNPVLIKRYQNRKLYNTQTSCYITLDDIQNMVENDTHFVVIDQKTRVDRTGEVLVAIRSNQELKNPNLRTAKNIEKLIKEIKKNSPTAELIANAKKAVAESQEEVIAVQAEECVEA